MHFRYQRTTNDPNAYAVKLRNQPIGFVFYDPDTYRWSHSNHPGREFRSRAKAAQALQGVPIAKCTTST